MMDQLINADCMLQKWWLSEATCIIKVKIIAGSAVFYVEESADGSLQDVAAVMAAGNEVLRQ